VNHLYRFYSQRLEQLLDHDGDRSIPNRSPFENKIPTIRRSFDSEDRPKRKWNNNKREITPRNRKPRSFQSLQSLAEIYDTNLDTDGQVSHPQNVLEVERWMDSDDLNDAWLQFIQDFHDDAYIELVPKDDVAKTRQQLDHILVAINNVRWNEILSDTPIGDRKPMPLMSKLYKDLQSKVNDVDEIMLDFCTKAALQHLRLIYSSQDLNTSIRRHHLEDLLDFLTIFQPYKTSRGLLNQISVQGLRNVSEGIQGINFKIADLLHINDIQVTKKITTLLLIILSLFEKGKMTFRVADSFVKHMDHILGKSEWTNEIQTPLFDKLLAQGISEIDARSFIDDVKVKTGSSTASDLPTKVNPKHNAIETLSERVQASIGRSLEEQNLELIDKAWRIVRERLNKLSEEEKSNPEVWTMYEQFLLAFRKMRQASSTLEVWNTMIKNKCTPRRRTWNIMLKGCHYQKEADQMEIIWLRMLKSGIKPDNITWSTRIHGLFNMGKINQGYQALAEMSHGSDKLIMKGQRHDNGIMNDSPRPSTETLNAALSGVARFGDTTVTNLLSWARGQQIEPDIITYNILINISLANKQRDQARAIIQRMKTKGIQPDSATFTILLTDLFHSESMNNLNSKQQTDEIFRFIKNVEDDGMSLDVRGYNLLVDRLLKICENTQAVNMIVDQMLQKGIHPTPHTFTILCTHYFDQNPPDLTAVQNLWNRIESSPYRATDVIFFDRMLEGYARHNDYNKTMYFLKRMAKEGKRPGWLALIEVLKCMMSNHKLNQAKELISDIEQKEGILKWQARGRKGCEEFWSLARQYRLV